MFVTGRARIIFEFDQEILRLESQVKELQKMREIARDSLELTMKAEGVQSLLNGALSLRSSSKVSILDEDSILEDYKRPDKNVIRRALQQGTRVLGAELVFSEHLHIDSKRLGVELDAVLTTEAQQFVEVTEHFNKELGTCTTPH